MGQGAQNCGWSLGKWVVRKGSIKFLCPLTSRDAPTSPPTPQSDEVKPTLKKTKPRLQRPHVLCDMIVTTI